MRCAVIDIGGTAIKYGIFTNGSLSLSGETPSNGCLGGEHIMREAEQVLSSLLPFDGIGVSTAGQVSVPDGEILFANRNIPHYTGTPVRARLQKKFGVPVSVDNDVNCAAIGEFRFGAAKGYSDFLCVTFGTGIGGAIYADGHLQRGVSGAAGEFGHIITHAHGLSCACGGAGCYEAYASVSALIRSAEKILGPSLTGRIFFDKIKTGDIRAQSILDIWIDEVSIGLISLIHIFNPPLLVLGGGIMNEPSVVREIQSRLVQNAAPALSAVHVVHAQLGNQAALYGAYENLCVQEE